MLINLSNHPSEKWDENQKNTAEQMFGNVVDMPFPTVDPQGDEAYVYNLADDFVQRILNLNIDDKVVVHIMGEMNFTYVVVSMLKQFDIECVASTTMRYVSENKKGEKIVTFEFEQFRKY